MKTHPKVLLLCSFSQNTANGITIANLFKGWAKERIALAEFNDGPDAVCVSGIRHYYFLGHQEMRYIAPFHLLRKFGDSKILRNGDSHRQESEVRGQKAGGWSQEAVERTGSVSVRLKNSFKESIVKWQRWYLRKTGLMLVSRKFRISPDFEEWVREFDPDIIYCVTGDLCKLEFFQQLLQHFDKKGCIHVFDDFLASKHEGTLLPRYWKLRLDCTFRRVCDFCSLHLAIGDKMAAEYSQRYGHPFYGFHNPIDSTVWLRPETGNLRPEGETKNTKGKALASDLPATDAPKTDYWAQATPCPISHLSAVAQKAKEDIPSSESVFRFLYAGKINRDTVGPIKLFVSAVERLRSQGHQIRFGIHSPYPFEEIERLLGSSAREVYLGKILYEELPAAYRKADGLLLPLDFMEATIRYIRLSMLTKASEYMISGTPIFCFAPKEIAVSEYLIEHEAAMCCGTPEQLEASMLRFMEDADARQRVSANAVKRATSHHMMEQVNERLRKLIYVSLDTPR
jgi:glycosyltransferase involved in cell wall biosynthesis